MASLRGLMYALLDPKALMFRWATRTSNLSLQKWLVQRPVTFNEHIRYRLVHDRDPRLVTFADKIESKHYIAQILGAGYSPNTIQVADQSSDLVESQLPHEYAIKVNHASGGVILVSEDFAASDPVPPRGAPLSRLRVRPEDARLTEIGSLLDHWLTITYGTLKGEWAYSQVKPRIIVEEYLRNESEHPPPDFKFFVFGGQCKAVRIDQYRDDGKFRYHYTRDGTFIDVRFAEFARPLFEHQLPVAPLPDNFHEMITIAEKLAQGLDFLRVDLYELNGRILVGELTAYPTSGTARYVPRSFDKWLGEAWPSER